MPKKVHTKFIFPWKDLVSPAIINQLKNKKVFHFLGIFFVSLFFAHNVFAAELGIFTDSGFASPSKEFLQGQTIYIKVDSKLSGDKNKVLNLRNNNYDLIKSYTLTKKDGYFTTSLSAPDSEGYFSIEAKIESGGSVVNSVKTIKVGSAKGDSNVKVSIKNSTNGQQNTEISNTNDQKIDDNNKEASPAPQASEVKNIQHDSLIVTFWKTVKSLFNFLWIF